jgi:hypothetical protein
MHADLIWLAENVSKWHNKMDRISRQPNSVSWFDQVLFPGWKGFTREQWQAARDELKKVTPWQVAEDEILMEESSLTKFCNEIGATLYWQSEQDSRAKLHPDTHNENPFTTPDEDEAWEEAEHRMNAIARNGNDGDAYPQARQLRYQDDDGGDWIDKAARTLTPQEFRGAMRFTIGKYNRRMGKKDDLISEIEKMRDYCNRWLEVEQGR